MTEQVTDGGWWCIHSNAILSMLRRAHGGEDPDMIYAEFYVNSDHEYHGDD